MFDAPVVYEWSENAGRLAIGGGPLLWAAAVVILGFLTLKGMRLARLAIEADGFAMRAKLIPRDEAESPKG